MSNFRQRGLSLIEVLISMVIIGVSVAGGSHLHMAVVRQSDNAFRSNEALQIAESQLAIWRLHIATNSSFISAEENTVEQDGRQYQLHRQEKTTAITANSQLRHITLTIRWTDGQSNLKSLQFQTAQHISLKCPVITQV